MTIARDLTWPVPPSHSHPWQPNHALRSDEPRAPKAFLLRRRHHQRTICHHAILHERMTRVEGRAPCHRHRESRVIDSVQFGLAGHRPSLIKATYVTAAAAPSLSVGQAGDGRRRFLMDLADVRRACDSRRDVSLLVSLFIALSAAVAAAARLSAAGYPIPLSRKCARCAIALPIGIPCRFLKFQPQFSKSFPPSASVTLYGLSF